MSSNETAPIPTLGVRIFGSVSYALLAINGLILNTLLIIIFIRSKSVLRKNAFYTIAWQLIICDILTHSMEFLVPIPITFASSQIYGDTLFLYVPCFIDTIVYNGTLFFSFLMTVNRFTVFILPNINILLFQKPGLYFMIGGMWAFVVLFIVGINVFACYKSFDENGFYYHHVCPPFDKMNKFGYFLKMFSAYASSYLPLLMFITYLFMIVFIKTKLNFEWSSGRIIKRQSTSINSDHGMSWKTEFNLLAQSFLICAFIEIQNLAFDYMPMIPVSGQWSIIMNIFGNWISLLLSSIHPIVLFTFNKDIRSRLKNLLGIMFKTQNTKVVRLSSSQALSVSRAT